ncbi:hypothetical protein [Alienimonas californiensis]|uniref:Uncharacterized protein n=1 Tax=Alienimonas californiensis TaxID=2527989 RepID=A0A517PAR1_9PLAN|nr:hypothetical protein [Alienimonas californiensis]QDT16460.1 hypothetical protein CA12_25630 [Alienimonas californiensis]
MPNRSKKKSLNSLRIDRDGITKRRRSPRFNSRYLESALKKRRIEEAAEEELRELDPEIDCLVSDSSLDADGDGDFILKIPGRPGKPANTWNLVYGHRAVRRMNGLAVGFTVPCDEPGCPDRLIVLNGKGQEVPGITRKPLKPPVCHIVPWAALETELIQKESQAKKRLRDDFRKAVCWEPTNLQPGHAACNLRGVKTTAQTVTATEAKAARQVIAKVEQDYATKKQSIWAG